MKTGLAIGITLLIAGSTLAQDARKFTASDIPNARMKKPGLIVIKNDHKSITAFRFFGDISESLVSLKSRRIRFNPFGASVFNTSARATKVPLHFQEAINAAGRQHGVDPRLISAIARRESAWNPRAVSRVGASGLMQLMPATAKFLGVSDVFDPAQNIQGGTRYLRTLLDTFDGDLDLTLAAYNAGPGAVAKYNGVPPYRETRDYVRIVRASYEASLKTN